MGSSSVVFAPSPTVRVWSKGRNSCVSAILRPTAGLRVPRYAQTENQPGKPLPQKNTKKGPEGPVLDQEALRVRMLVTLFFLTAGRRAGRAGAGRRAAEAMAIGRSMISGNR